MTLEGPRRQCFIQAILEHCHAGILLVKYTVSIPPLIPYLGGSMDSRLRGNDKG